MGYSSLVLRRGCCGRLFWAYHWCCDGTPGVSQGVLEGWVCYYTPGRLTAGTWKSSVWIGKSSSKPPFLGPCMLIFRIVLPRKLTNVPWKIVCLEGECFPFFFELAPSYGTFVQFSGVLDFQVTRLLKKKRRFSKRPCESFKSGNPPANLSVHKTILFVFHVELVKPTT